MLFNILVVLLGLGIVGYLGYKKYLEKKTDKGVAPGGEIAPPVPQPPVQPTPVEKPVPLTVAPHSTIQPGESYEDFYAQLPKYLLPYYPTPMDAKRIDKEIADAIAAGKFDGRYLDRTDYDWGLTPNGGTPVIVKFNQVNDVKVLTFTIPAGYSGLTSIKTVDHIGSRPYVKVIVAADNGFLVEYDAFNADSFYQGLLAPGNYSVTFQATQSLAFPAQLATQINHS